MSGDNKLQLGIGLSYVTRDGRETTIQTKSDDGGTAYGRLPYLEPFNGHTDRLFAWRSDGATPSDATGAQEYATDLVREVGANVAYAGPTAEVIALPVRDTMPKAAAGGIGDINSDAKGSGARYNAGKAPIELIPLRQIGTAHIMRASLSEPQFAAAKALQHLGDYQSRRRGIGALYDALVALGFEGWEECARVFDYGRKKYAAWNWAKGMQWSVPLACAGRHLEFGILRGEQNDPESGLPHRGHVFCNIVMLLAFADTFTEGDDRPAAGLLAIPIFAEAA
jgi:hypothetical protein